MSQEAQKPERKPYTMSEKALAVRKRGAAKSVAERKAEKEKLNQALAYIHEKKAEKEKKKATKKKAAKKKAAKK